MDEDTKLGKCCICEIENESVRNVMTLHKEIPPEEKNGGWGCFVCDRPARGAVAVLCDDCLDNTMGDQPVEIKFACLGYPGENRRIEIEKLTVDFDHDMSKHPEENQMFFVNPHTIFCQNCQEIVSIIKGRCELCDENICPHCGCTDSEACIDGCYWTPSGICSACEENLEADFV